MLSELYKLYTEFSQILLIIIAWAFWSARQKFITRKEFEEYREAMNKKMVSLNTDLSEMKVELKHISKNIDEIKDYIRKTN